MDFYRHTKQEVIKHFKTDIERGLSNENYKNNLSVFGKNKLLLKHHNFQEAWLKNNWYRLFPLALHFLQT